MSNELPITEKFILTIKEASQYSNIGINRLSRMLDDRNRSTTTPLSKLKKS